jgi:hypothetical protein
MFQAELAEGVGFVARPVIGKHPLDSDAELTVPGHRRSQEVRGAALGMVRIHGHEGEPQVVVDGHVQEHGADAFDAVAAIAGDAVGWPLDLDQPLDVQIQQVARSRVLIAVGRQLRLDMANAVQRQPPLSYAPATLSKIRNIMSALFNHAIRHEWIQRDPIAKVRASATRVRELDVLSPGETLCSSVEFFSWCLVNTT